MPTSPDQTFVALGVHKLTSIFCGFFPIDSLDDGIFPRLSVECVIEFLFRMHFAIVNVNCGEKQLAGCGGGETKRHRVHVLTALAQLKDRKSIRGILRQRFPNRIFQAELRVQSAKVSDRWHK